MRYLMVGIGGMLGSMLRYGIGLWIAAAGSPPAGRFPWATFLVNVVGSLLIGMALESLIKLGHAYYLLGVVGFCGGFTTFSAFSADLVRCFRAGAWGTGLLYLSVSVLCCVLAAWAGMLLASRWE